MKRILSIVAVLAIVSGALAFKARLLETPSIVCLATAPDPQSPCPTATATPFIADPAAPVFNPCTSPALPYSIANPLLCPVVTHVRAIKG